MAHNLTIPQALFLLARDDRSGKPIGNYNGYIQPAGALAELILRERLVLLPGRKARVRVTDDRPTDDTYLDAVLVRIAKSRRQRTLQHWVGKLQCMKGRVRLIGADLARQGIVEEVTHRYLGLFPVTRWRLARAGPKNSLKSDMSRILFAENRTPDEWTSTVITIANAGHLLKRNFNRTHLRQHKKHIKAIIKDDWPAASAAAKAIQATLVAVASFAAIS